MMFSHSLRQTHWTNKQWQTTRIHYKSIKNGPNSAI